MLNAHLFESLAELRVATDAWLRIYNSERPHDGSAGCRRECGLTWSIVKFDHESLVLQLAAIRMAPVRAERD